MFLLSFDDRDPLAAQISAFGWRVSAARRDDKLKTRFLSAHALIAVIDVRDADGRGLHAIQDLTPLSVKGGFAIIALGDETSDSEIAQKCLRSGATHFLDIANPHADLRSAIDFAYRYVENVRGGAEVVQSFHNMFSESDDAWSYSTSDLSKNWVSDHLQRRLPSYDFQLYPITAIYRQFSKRERGRARGAMGRLKDGSAQAAVPHEIDGERVIHHLHQTDDRLYGRIEYLAPENADKDWTDRDILSGLRNSSAARVWIKDRLSSGKQIGLIALGLKNFRTINAAFGRLIGDQLLRVIGQRLMSETNRQNVDECLVSRFDGQNFLISIALENDQSPIADLAEHLLQSVFAPVEINGRNIQMIARAGIALSIDSRDEGLLLRRVSLALAEAIAADAVLLKVNSASDADVALEHQLEEQLAEAIDQGDIVVAFQPQMKVETGQLVGAEALARWDHPEYGLLGAATLFAVAERAGLMAQLSMHIHRRALSEAAQWPDSLSFLRLSINTTAIDLAAPGFVEQILDQVAESGFPRDRLTLEITESELIGDMANSVYKLSQLRERGVRIAIDDFGTGYSSLAYLKELPLDYLKIDSGLTGDIGGSAKDRVVVRSIINMAHSLDLLVIAEGVETEAQLELLAAQNCEYYQGFLRSSPLPPEEFEIFALRSN